MSTVINDDDKSDYGMFNQTYNELQLFGAFALVAAYLTLCSEGLNVVERMTVGTSYHLMLQRIYREIMMVGFASFAFTIFDHTNVSLQSGFYVAFGFADLCCFVMACVFCFQGCLIMLGSVGQSRLWHIAANISSPQLHVDVEKVRNTLAWKWRYFPFCTTRDEVEFRILRTIFQSAYTISTAVGDFDFGMFLRATHEANILSIIEISAIKWCLVLFLTAVTCIEIAVWAHHCNTSDCNASMSIWIFSGGGCINLFLAIVLYYWGRTSELRLLQTSGVMDCEDYVAFVLTEDDAHDALQDTAKKNNYVRDTITELIAEEREKKLLEQKKQFKARFTGTLSQASMINKIKMIRERSKTIFTSRQNLRVSPSRSDSNNDSEGVTGAASSESAQCVRAGSQTDAKLYTEIQAIPEGHPDCLAEMDEESSSISSRAPFGDNKPIVDTDKRVKEATPGTNMLEGSNPGFGGVLSPKSNGASAMPPKNLSSHSGTEVTQADHPDSLVTEDISSRTCPSTRSAYKPAEKETGAGADVLAEPHGGERCVAVDEVKDGIDDVFSSPKSNAAPILSPKIRSLTFPVPSPKRNNGLQMVDIDAIEEIEAADNSTSTSSRKYGELVSRQVSKRPFALGREESESQWRKSLKNFITTGITQFRDKAKKHSKKAFKSRLKRNTNRQNFRDVFPLGKPELFYGLISFVMTCNSLYLAWWFTRVIPYAFGSGVSSPDRVVMFAVLSLLPSLLAFPILALAIRSSSILKAITFLNLNIVGAVMDKTAANNAALEEFRTKFLESCRKEDPLNHKIGMLKICRRYSSDGIMLSRTEFGDMVLACGLLYSPEKLKFIFSYVDINGGATVDMGEFESFLFTEDKKKFEEKRRQLQNKMNSQYLITIGKRNVAKKIIENLSPFTKTGVVMHRAASESSISDRLLATVRKRL
mmetsp:Transcript_20925/g.30153  ORF Transcript_20925/g.30153 Transcript_20925/m.30153 type:complete len:929 (+) Transcript_20925:135-2921(+)